MIGFDLPCDLKEVELMEHNNKPIHIKNKKIKRHVIHSDILSSSPTNILDILHLTRSHAIGMAVSINPKSLSQAYLPVSKDPNFQSYANDSGI